MSTSWANAVFSSERAVNALARFRTLRAAGKIIPWDLARDIELALELHAGSAMIRDTRDRHLIKAAECLSGHPWARASVIASIAGTLERGQSLAEVASGVPAAALDWIGEAQRISKIPNTERQIYRIIAPALK